jgi:hypothetical protein
VRRGIHTFLSPFNRKNNTSTTSCRQRCVFICNNREFANRMGCSSSSSASSKKLTGAQRKKLANEKNKSSPQAISLEIDPMKLIARVDVPILMGSDYRVENYIASGGGTISQYPLLFSHSSQREESIEQHTSLMGKLLP